MTMATTRLPRKIPHHRARPQRGAVLIVALIVLVALALAALSLLRSVDVLGLVANNLSLQRSALNTTDIGVNRALVKLNGVINKTVSETASCYSARMLETDARGIPTALSDSATFDTAYPGCSITTSVGETARFIIDRQCGFAGIVDKSSCVLAILSPGGSDTLSPGTDPRLWPTYRVTVRVDGSKNAQSYTQNVTY